MHHVSPPSQSPPIALKYYFRRFGLHNAVFYDHGYLAKYWYFFIISFFAVYMESAPDRVADNNGSANEKVHKRQMPDQTVADCPQRFPQNYNGDGCQVTDNAKNGAANQEGSTPRVLHQHPTGSDVHIGKFYSISMFPCALSNFLSLNDSN